MQASGDPDVRSQTRMLVATAASGVLLALGAVVVASGGAAAGVGLGAALALANLWVIVRIVRALMGQGGRPLFWALVGALKLVLLVGAAFLLVFAGFADILPLALGYGALPLGIIGGGLSAPTAKDERG
jgi:hypothetical protein